MQREMQREMQQPAGLTKFCKQNELSRLKEDVCYIGQRDSDSKKPFNLTTWHWHPYPKKPQATCYPGQFFTDGYVGGATVDQESKVNRFPGYQMTKGKYRHTLGTLPVNMPRVRGYFDADTESSLRWEASFDKKQCTNTTEKSFIPYSFSNFESLCYDPQDPTYIIPEDTFDKTYPNARFWHRSGEPSRFDRQENYRNCTDWNVKYIPKNLSYSNFGY